MPGRIRHRSIPCSAPAGKRLATTAFEAVVELAQPPRLLFASADAPPPHPNHIRFRFGGTEEGISVTMQVKVPGEEPLSRPIDLGFRYDTAFGVNRSAAYERVVSDALAGNRSLFAREDGVEQAWRVVMRALEQPSAVLEYEPGSWGPAEADRLVPGGWHNPA